MSIPYEQLSEGTQNLLREIFGSLALLDLSDDGWVEVRLPRTADKNPSLKVGKEEMKAFDLEKAINGLGIRTEFDTLRDRTDDRKSQLPIFRIHLDSLRSRAEQLDAAFFPPINFEERLAERAARVGKAPVKNALQRTADMTLKSLSPQALALLETHFGSANVLRCEDQHQGRMVVIRMPPDEQAMVYDTRLMAEEIEHKLDEMDVSCSRYRKYEDGREGMRFLAINIEQLSAHCGEIGRFLTCDPDVPRFRPAPRKKPTQAQREASRNPYPPTVRTPVLGDLPAPTRAFMTRLFGADALANELRRNEKDGTLFLKAFLPTGLIPDVAFRDTGSTLTEIIGIFAELGIAAQLEAKNDGQQLVIPVETLNRRLPDLAARLKLPVAFTPKVKTVTPQQLLAESTHRRDCGEAEMAEAMFGQGDPPSNIVKVPFHGLRKKEIGVLADKEKGRQ